jgi:hypothetical protein
MRTDLGYKDTFGVVPFHLVTVLSTPELGLAVTLLRLLPCSLDHPAVLVLGIGEVETGEMPDGTLYLFAKLLEGTGIL